MTGELHERYGLNTEEARRRIENRIKEIRRTPGPRPEDFHGQAISLVLDRRFHEASDKFYEAGQGYAHNLDLVRQQEAQLIQTIVEEYRRAGDARYKDSDFSAALGRYREALNLVQIQLHPELWASVQVDVGLASARIGENSEGPPANTYLSQAVTAYRAALDVYSRNRERFREQWAATQNNLGNSLEVQGARTARKEGRELLSEAVAAFKASLEIYTREQYPERCAATETNLGNALDEQAKRTAGKEGRELLTQAVTAFNTALGIYSRKAPSHEWAMTENNLGDVLNDQASLDEDGDEGLHLMVQAVAHFNAALDFWRREQFPQEWALVKNNLCTAFQDQGKRTAGEKGLQLLADAVTACRAALEIRTREQSPQQWATTTNNLCGALREEGVRINGDEGIQTLNLAVRTCREALGVYTKSTFGQQWASTQNNLGTALAEKAVRIGRDAGRPPDFSEALDAFQSALEVRTRRDLPLQWAETHANLAKIYTAVGEWAESAESLQNVLLEFTNDSQAHAELGWIYHDRLFDFQAAFTLESNWIAKHPGDVLTRENLAEAVFTLGRFGDAETQLTELLANSNVETRARVTLLALDAAVLLVEQKRDQAISTLEGLINLISAQPAEFSVNWQWEGTIHFIENDVRLKPLRSPLRQLFGAFNGSNREAILAALRDAKSGL
jgi:tetratricopeptide (TPR) repeat protein